MENKGCCKAIKDDYLVCTCMEVMHSQIVDAIQQGDTTFEKLSDKLGVGTGCTSCVDEINEILREELKKEERK